MPGIIQDGSDHMPPSEGAGAIPFRRYDHA